MTLDEMNAKRVPLSALIVAPLLFVAAGCTTTPTPSPTPTLTGTGPAPVTASSTASASAPTTSTTATTGDTPTATPVVPRPVSIQALIAKTYDGHGLTLGREGGSTTAYRQYYATYRGGGLTISGRINIPRGAGPFPAVVLAHGYVDPAVYTNGQTMLRERDHLARQGYVTLHIDYRGHAQSTKVASSESDLRLGYTEDAINAGLALQADSRVDPDRIAIVGRSMGGGVVYNALVAKPGLFKAGVAYSPVSADAVDNFNRWMRDDPAIARRITDQLGTPEAAPDAWADASAENFFDRMTEPIMIHHGTADEDCPIEWSNEAVAKLKAAGQPVTYHVYPGQRHTFTSQWPLSIRRTTAFLDQHLG